jgi:hypothetical protein
MLQDNSSRPLSSIRRTSHRAKCPCNSTHTTHSGDVGAVVRIVEHRNPIFIHSYTYTHSYANVQEESLSNPSTSFMTL